MHGYLFLIGNLYRFYIVTKTCILVKYDLLTVLGEHFMFSLTDTRETVVTVQDAYLIG